MSNLGKVRLQKFISDAGAASRRKAEELILEGAVLVNGEIISTLPAFVDPERDKVIVRGSVVRPQQNIYLMMNKPKNVVCTSGQKKGRQRVIDLLPPMDFTVLPVGRLDPEATGLVLITNDGELAQRVAHPRYEVPKRYRAEVDGEVGEDLLVKLRRGVYLSEGKAAALDAEIEFARPDRSAILVTTYDAIPRQVQRMFARFGHEVKNLQRVSIGPLNLRAVPVGAVRELTQGERNALVAAVSKTRRTKRGVKRSEASRGTHTGDSRGMSGRGRDSRFPARGRGKGGRSDSGTRRRLVSGD